MNTKIISLDEKRDARMEPQPIDTQETIHFDRNTCPTCKTPIRAYEHGWVRTAEISEKTGWKSAIAPCPTCSGDVQAKVEARRKAALLEKLFNGANIPFQYADWTFASFPPKNEEKQQACRFVQNWIHDMLSGAKGEKRGLYLHGDLGVGKTSLAVSALKEVLHAGQPGLFVSTRQMLKRIRDCYAKDAAFSEDEILRALTETPYVVIDDLGAEKPTEYVVDQLHTIIEQRLNSGFSTIITSNRLTKKGDDSLLRYWSKQPSDPSDAKKPDELTVRRLLDRILQHCDGITVRGGNIRSKER
jgi:DNA replication protein DnaC